MPTHRELECVRASKQALEQQLQSQVALVAARKDGEIQALRARLDAATQAATLRYAVSVCVCV